MIQDIDPALQNKLSAIVGSENLLLDEKTCARLARTTLPEGTIPLGVIRPDSRDAVQSILKVLQGSAIPVYPISTGKNWGYGDACAPRDGCLILDLSRMNRILEVNTTLAYAVIEPGVTQGQLAAHLKTNAIPLQMDCTGSGPEAGLIGNILERGFGHSPYGDRFAHSCNYEVVLSDGSLLNTGFGGYPNAKAQNLYKWGIGPSLDGLFTQGNFGVVTRMTMWLMPKPACRNYYFIGLSDPAGMAELAERLRPLYLTGTLRNALHCANDQRLLASSMQFPWGEADGKSALNDGHSAVYQRLYKQFNLLAWSCAGVLMGSSTEVAAAKGELKCALKGMIGLDKFFVLSDRLYDWSQILAQSLPAWNLVNPLLRDLAKVRWMVELMRGEPSYQFLTGAHWRARQKIDGKTDPLETESGLIWISPMLPMTREAVHEVNHLAAAVFQESGFEYQVTYSFANERSLAAIMSISFDHHNPEESVRAAGCLKKLIGVLLDKGYIPYRGSLAVQRILQEAAPEYWKKLQQLQHSWDNAGRIAPGRYNLI